MGKVAKNKQAKPPQTGTSAQSAKSAAPDHLTMCLFDPGMSLLHRAGLGGLACTLKAMERRIGDGTISKDALPSPYINDEPPWEIREHEITLKFGQAEHAGAYLKKLFAFAFSVRKKEGLIELPGQHEREPPLAALADLQSGLTLTFLQHGKVRQLAKEPTPISYDPENEGVPGVIVQYRKCSGFKHQVSWEDFVDKKGCLTTKVIKVDGPVCPGAVVRHVAFTGDTAAENPASRMLPLVFSIVGCLALPVNRGVAALLVPEVENLIDFVFDRPAMTPITPRDCQIANAADAAFRSQIRLRENQARIASVALRSKRIGGCYAMTFMPTAWASQQKSRVATIHVPPGDAKILDRYARAVAQLPPRIVTKVKESTGKGKQRQTVERNESFRTDSVVRPHIADNLAVGRPWYANFVKLMTKINPATDKPFRNQLSFERKGLHAMISDPAMWDEEGETLIVKSVHEAIRQSLGRIREETDGKAAKGLSQATKNRWERFREKLRIDLAGAKTQAHVRFALTDLFSRGGNNAVLKEGWAKVLPVLRTDWQLARDLGLLALASYASKGDTKDGEFEE